MTRYARPADLLRGVGIADPLRGGGTPFVIDGSNYDAGTSVAVDAGGNLVVAGVFSGTANFNHQGGTDTLTARGDTDGFVAKYTPAGRLLWAKQVGGDYTDKILDDYPDRDPITNPTRLGKGVGRVGDTQRSLGEYINAVAVGPDGTVYLTGGFRGEAFFDAINGKSVVYRSGDDDYQDAFLMKISADGQTQWVNAYGGRFDDVGMDVKTDPSGNVYVGGYFTRTADFDAGRGQYLLTARGRDDGFVMRVNPAGKLIYINTIGGDATDENERDAVNALAIDTGGNIFAAGTFSDTADFAPGRTRYDLQSAGSTDAFTAYYSARGKLVWAQGTGGNGYDGNTSLALDPRNDASAKAGAGALVVGGYFSDKADVAPGPVQIELRTAQTSDGNREFTDLLVSKLTTAGKFVWAKPISGPFLETMGQLTVDSDGSIYTTGAFFRDVDLDPGPGEKRFGSVRTDEAIKDSNSRFSRRDSYDLFVQRLSTNGKYLYATTLGAAGDDFGSGLAVVAPGQVAITGRYVGPVQTGDLTLPATIREGVFVNVLDDLLRNVSARFD